MIYLSIIYLVGFFSCLIWFSKLAGEISREKKDGYAIYGFSAFVAALFFPIALIFVLIFYFMGSKN
jgi:hypothetical protein